MNASIILFPAIFEFLRSVLPLEFSPSIKLLENRAQEQNFQLIKNLQLADNITINITKNLENPDQSKSSAIISVKDSEHQESIYLETDESNLVQENLFSIGTHLVINKQSLWQENNKSVTIGDLHIVPLKKNQEIDIKTNKSGRNIRFFLEQDSLNLTFWENSSKKIILEQLNQAQFNDELWNINNYRISYKPYSNKEHLAIPQYSDKIITFDENIVKEAILLTRKHTYKRTEYFLLVISHQD